jgi:phosphatidylglycerol lysyltransferase
MIAAVPGTTMLSIDPREQFLREFGSNSLSHSSLQEGMSFFLEPAYGYIAYSPIKADIERPLCLADPICSGDNLEQLIRLFLEKHKGATFIHITKQTATILSKLGFVINEIGVETIIDAQNFSLSGGGKEFLRSQRNRAAKDGLVVREQLCSEVPLQLLKQISSQWMATKVNGQELSFLVRPARFDDETDVRKFFAYKDDRLVGFNFFDPIYRGGQIIGYLDNTHRSVCEFSYSIADYINLEAMRQFKLEGKEIVSLGYSPLFALSDTGEFRYSQDLKKTLQYLYEHGNFLYDFKGAAFHKTRYRPGTEGCQDIKLYCACTNPVPIFHLDKVFKRCGIDPIRRLAEHGLRRILRFATRLLYFMTFRRSPDNCRPLNKAIVH